MSGAFVRERLPEWRTYADAEGLTLQGTGPWVTTECRIHGGSDSLRVNLKTGGWCCMSCGAKGGDVLSHYMQRTGVDFLTAAHALGAVEGDGKPGRTERPRTLAARDALELLYQDAMLVWVAAGNLAKGMVLTRHRPRCTGRSDAPRRAGDARGTPMMAVDRVTELRKRADAVADAAPAVRLVRGDAVILEAVRWLWPGFLPAGMLTILGWRPRLRQDDHRTIPRGDCGPVAACGRVARGARQSAMWWVWSGEDAHPVLAARLQAMGADMRRVHFVDGISGSEGESFDPGRDMPLLEATVERLAAPRLLILDPIVSAVTGDSHKGAEVRRSLQPVVALAQRLGCAVVGVTHFSKGTAGRDPAERITGSIAFAALAAPGAGGRQGASRRRGRPAPRTRPRQIQHRSGRWGLCLLA